MKRLTPCQAIKKYCKEQCCAGELEHWKNCTAKLCSLWLLRKGKRPTPLELQEWRQAEKEARNPSFFDRNSYSVAEVKNG